MTTPFDDIVQEIIRLRYHNHRLEGHSDTVGQGILRDLNTYCEPFAGDLAAKTIRHWMNLPAPGARRRKMDLLVGEPAADLAPDLRRIRICIENKSVVTAHRNRDARFDDLNESLQVIHRVKAEAVLVATVMIGVADRVLNVPDKIKPMYRDRKQDFYRDVQPRLSSGDQGLWQEFAYAVSTNRAGDAEKTVEKFRQLPLRPPGHTHVVGYDFVLLVPIRIDNVNPPALARSNRLGIDIDAEYTAMLTQVCKAYRARWHP